MSTKVSLSYDKEYHFYQEIFDVSNVYLKMDKAEFEATNNSVMIKIPIKMWRKIIKDWAERGWSESEDNSEKEFVDEWLKLPLFTSNLSSDETVIFNRKSNEED